MTDIDFEHIAPRLSGKSEAFEELCCQIARRTISGNTSFTRLRGSGGDGGVECYADLPDGSRIGYQAKYIFNVDSLLKKATESLSTALSLHETLTKYILCFPFNLTGKTRRRGRSGTDKYEEWREKHVSQAAHNGRQLTIEIWPSSELLSLLMDYDTSGGMREYFFNKTILTRDWFSKHIDQVIEAAGPRYTPEVHVATDLWKWFKAFERSEGWVKSFLKEVSNCQKELKHLSSEVHRTSSELSSPSWPEELREEAQTLVHDMELFLGSFETLVQSRDRSDYCACVDQIKVILDKLRAIESQLEIQLENRYGKGTTNSAGFRQFHAEFNVSFPMANLDFTREVVKSFEVLQDFLKSPVCYLGFEQAFILRGKAGSGKTHGICDIAQRRLIEGHYSCVVFGHEFSGDTEPWTCIIRALGLPYSFGRDQLLDSLDAAAESSGAPILICVDAINETRPRQYWYGHLSKFVKSVKERRYLLLCVICRTSYTQYCLPEDHQLKMVEHLGFTGIEYDACNSYFKHYGLVPPIIPILQPEFANPLYLKLVCETLKDRGLLCLPAGWSGFSATIRAFLEEKEKKFAIEHETIKGANIISNSIIAITHAIAESNESAIVWSRAQQIIDELIPQTRGLRVLEWLVVSDLLLEDMPNKDHSIVEESFLRPAFDRFGDFLVAQELIDTLIGTGFRDAFLPNGLLYAMMSDSSVVGDNSSVISALSILLPEAENGLELPDFLEDEAVRSVVLLITVDSLLWRDPASLTEHSRDLLLEILRRNDITSWDALDALLSVSWQPSPIDAFWFDKLLKSFPIAKRDAWWCHYLYERYESNGTVRRLIEAVFEVPLDKVEEAVTERWLVVLLWFTAAADRRVKDWATRAVTALLTAHPNLMPKVVTRFLFCNDDEVRERLLLSCYGALILTRESEVVAMITKTLLEAYGEKPSEFDNAMIRDHIRSIAELAREINSLPSGFDPELTMQPIDSEWPLSLPSDEEIEELRKLPKVVYSCMHDDFFIYSLSCLRPWEDSFPKPDMGKWILQRVTQGMEYNGSAAEHYDRLILNKYGGGRGKPSWAERIGKKYQWLAMYQLASRLNDHVERKSDEWYPEPKRTPLILCEERKLDPTLPLKLVKRVRSSQAWWVGASADFSINQDLSDEEWVHAENDLPLFEALLAIQERDDQRFRALVSYLTWDVKEEDYDWDIPFRQVWTHIESYLIPRNGVKLAHNCLHGRNLFGRWLPEGATLLDGFLGEYPWATQFVAYPIEWDECGRYGRKLPVVYVPSWNDLSIEYEYDASLEPSKSVRVPAREFFSNRDLWWDGRDGFRMVSGRTVFRDPSLTEKGPSALIADNDFLLEKLDEIGFSLIWTLLGEKWIIGGSHDDSKPRRTFSQIALINEDGTVEVSKRLFFDDYDKDTGPGQWQSE